MLLNDGQWRKPGMSAGGNCVEVRTLDGMVHVRNSRYPNGTILSFTPDEWNAFVAGAEDGEFDFESEETA